MSCCAPSSGRDSEIQAAATSGAGGSTDGMILLERSSFEMGAEDPWAYPEDGEGPVREVRVGPFWIDACAVSDARFGEFVDATGYITEAERFGWSFVFAGLLPDEFPATPAVAQAPWWRKVEGADWRHPEGPQSDLDARIGYPVVHASWNDANAYSAWAGKRLPTEAEWELAARGGLEQKVFPWGDELEPGGAHCMNVWQGDFPGANTVADGFYGTCPVDAFPANGFGLYNATGNVWEWTADWLHLSFRQRDSTTDPKGPPRGTNKVQKGGSYLCHHSYCRRYRIAARHSSTPDSSTGNVGFRCVRDV